jgi:hypothetical protein
MCGSGGENSGNFIRMAVSNIMAAKMDGRQIENFTADECVEDDDGFRQVDHF